MSTNYKIEKLICRTVGGKKTNHVATRIYIDESQKPASPKEYTLCNYIFICATRDKTKQFIT